MCAVGGGARVLPGMGVCVCELLQAQSCRLCWSVNLRVWSSLSSEWKLVGTGVLSLPLALMDSPPSHASTVMLAEVQVQKAQC